MLNFMMGGLHRVKRPCATFRQLGQQRNLRPSALMMTREWSYRKLHRESKPKVWTLAPRFGGAKRSRSHVTQAHHPKRAAVHLEDATANCDLCIRNNQGAYIAREPYYLSMRKCEIVSP